MFAAAFAAAAVRAWRRHSPLDVGLAGALVAFFIACEWNTSPGAFGAFTFAAGTILLGDSMGDMALYYAMADVALIGGSLLPLGGQNLIEACACGCPVVLGPHMFNFASAAADAVAVGAARRVHDARDAVRTMDEICADAPVRAEMAAAAQAFANAHRGATARTVTLIEASLARVDPASALQ